MKKFKYKKICENQASIANQAQQQNIQNQQTIQNSMMTPEDVNKIAMLNKELYNLASEKDQLYLKISNIQKNINDIKSRYNTKQSVTAQNNVENQDISSNIMESSIRIMDIYSYINEDERPANIIEFNDEPKDSNTQQETNNIVDNNTTIEESPKKDIQSTPQLNVDDKGKTEFIEGDKDNQESESGTSIYVKFTDDGKTVLGKIYKTDETSDWETRVIKGVSDTFEEMAFVKDLGVYGVLDKLEGFYDEVEIIKDKNVDNILSDTTNESTAPIFKFLEYK